MKATRGAVLLLVALAACSSLYAQIDNRGTDFYLGFMSNLGTPTLPLYLTGATATTGTVSVPGIGFSTNFTITPGTTTQVNVPSTAVAVGSNSVENKGIRVQAGAPISVYGLNQVQFTTDAFLGLPRTLLGTDHIVLGYTGGLGGPSEFLVVASENSTQVTITPSQAAVGRAAGVPFTITLNQLQTFQLQGQGNAVDLSGTTITSDKPIALFAGAVCTNIPTTSTVACDHVVEQVPATGTWGTNFLSVPLATRTGGDTFRIIARDNSTQVRINGGLVATLNRGQIHQTVLGSSSYNVIQTSGPALVAQYSNGSSFDGVTSDPFYMLLQPTEQFLRSYTLNTPTASPVAFNNFINVVVRTAEISSCRIDGGPFTAPFTLIGASGYSGARQPVAIGTHNLTCPSGFGAYTYGFASFDSYGYPGGLGLRFIATPRCDVNRDNKIDISDINAIYAARNTAASGPEDPRDADADLRITVADVRACQLKCTNANCAP